MAPQLQHEGLAEPHDFGVGLTARAEIGAAFAAAHGQCGEGILEGLFETEEFQYGKVYRSVEPDPPLYGPMALLNCTR